jgi:hypothetical protein
MQKPLFAAQ